VQRSLGWATTKKSITMTGQNKRKSSMAQLHQSFETISVDSRKNSLVNDRKNSFSDEKNSNQSRTNSLLDSPGSSRNNSLLDVDESRKNSSINDSLKSSFEYPEDGINAYEELLKYSARKFSLFVPQAHDPERTILDDIDYFMDKKECDYGMCQCCPIEKKLQTNWESIEEIIENDPEIIFDCDDNPIIVEPFHMDDSHTNKLPNLYENSYNDD
jgi:hypothetical protein